MPVEITEYDEMPEWMRRHLAGGEVTFQVGGQPASAREFATALDAQVTAAAADAAIEGTESGVRSVHRPDDAGTSDGWS